MRPAEDLLNPMSRPVVAYISMELALDGRMPTYCGGLGVLAGDTVRAAADMGLSMVAITLLHRKGYFFQKLDESGNQIELPVEWSVDDFLEELPQRVVVTIEGRAVAVRAWRYRVVGHSGSQVPVYLLDTDLEENTDWDRTLTHHLYGGDPHYRLCQEVVLGIGGVLMLRELGHTSIARYHMNEGHASLLVLELLDEEARSAGRTTVTAEDVEPVRRRCVFTTHTPVPAGHDRFPLDMVARVLGRSEVFDMKNVFCCDDVLNMTFLGFNLSHYINGVARRHGEISRQMFGQYTIDSITNGVHAVTWTSPPFLELYDRHLPGWRQDNAILRHALSIPNSELWRAHQDSKRRLLTRVNRESNLGMDQDVFTIGFARRATAYKRTDLIFHDLDRLRRLATEHGGIQLVFAGKAHPWDTRGYELIRRVFQVRDELHRLIKVVYLENYDLELGGLITSGCDLWLNNPIPPQEASGTSGMKAAINGVPSLSTLDGWWVEGHIEGVTGWAIGKARDMSLAGPGSDEEDARSLMDQLEKILLLYYGDRDKYLDVMRHAIALNGSHFNTQRMLREYITKAYVQ